MRDEKLAEAYAVVERALELGVSIRTHLERIAQPAADLMATLGIAGGDELTLFPADDPEGSYIDGSLVACVGAWLVIEGRDARTRRQACNLAHVDTVCAGLYRRREAPG